MAALHTMMGYTGAIGKDCYMGWGETINSQVYSQLFVGDTLVVNLAYNLGYMYNDVFNIASNN